MITGKKFFRRTKVSLMIEVLSYRECILSTRSKNYFTGFLFYLGHLWLLTAQRVGIFWPLCGLGSFEVQVRACPGQCRDVRLLLP